MTRRLLTVAILTTALTALTQTASAALPVPCDAGGEAGFVIYDGTCVTPSVYDTWYPDAGLENPANDPATRPSERWLGHGVSEPHRFIDLVRMGKAL